MRPLIKNILIILFFAVLLPRSSALNLDPENNKITFEPNMENQLKFRVINDEHRDLKLLIFARGKLSGSINLPKNIIEISKNQKSTEINYEFTMPDSLEPGKHSTEIVLMDIEKNNENILKIDVYSLVEGKYAEAEVDVQKNDDKSLLFIVNFFNKGALDILRAKANIEIFDSKNNKLATLNTQEKYVKSSEEADLEAHWKQDDYKNKYFAVITVFYDGKTQKIEKQFELSKITGNSPYNIERPFSFTPYVIVLFIFNVILLVYFKIKN